MCLYDSDGAGVSDCYSHGTARLENYHLQGTENETGKILGKPYSAEILCFQWTRIKRKSQLNSLGGKLLVNGKCG